MPQMSPIFWLALMIYFMIVLMMLIMIVFFYFKILPSIKYSMMKNYKSMNWTW